MSQLSVGAVDRSTAFTFLLRGSFQFTGLNRKLRLSEESTSAEGHHGPLTLISRVTEDTTHPECLRESTDSFSDGLDPSYIRFVLEQNA